MGTASRIRLRQLFSTIPAIVRYLDLNQNGMYDMRIVSVADDGATTDVNEASPAGAPMSYGGTIPTSPLGPNDIPEFHVASATNGTPVSPTNPTAVLANSVGVDAT